MRAGRAQRRNPYGTLSGISSRNRVRHGFGVFACVPA